jgi:hypothetical protein
MIRSAMYGKACWVLSVAAILIATVGVHVIHPLYHHCYSDSLEDQCEACLAGSTEPPQALTTEVQRALPHGPLPGCPVCGFLAAFHSGAPVGPVSLVSVDAPKDRPCVPPPAAPSASAWLPFGARGPPSDCLL